MAYAPGIQDISGQLIAQGMSQAGAARARAIESLGESISGGIRQYQQNRILTQQAIGKFGQGLENPEFKTYITSILSDDPNAPQVSPAIKTAVKNAQKGNVDVYDAAMLSSIVDTFAKSKEQQSQDMLRRAQAAQLFAQGAQMQDEIQRRRALARMMDVPFYATDQDKAPMPVQAQTPREAQAQRAPEAGAAPETQPAAAAPGMQPAPGQVTGPARDAAAAAARFIPTDLQGFTPAVAQAAQREAALEFLSTGKMGNRSLIAQRIAAEQRKQAGEERELTLAEGNALQEQFNAAEREKPIGVRRQMVVRASTRPGYVAPEIVMAEPSALEKRAIEAQNVGDKLRLERISATITEDKKAAAGDRLYAPAVGKLQSLIAEDKIEGGALTEFANNIRSFGSALGFKVDETQLADGQLARAYFGQLLIPLFINTKGATSDKDATLFASWNPQLAMNNKASAEMLKVIQAKIKLNRSLEQLGSQIDAEKITDKEYITERAKLLREYDDAIPDIDSFLSSVGAPPRNIAQNLGPAAVNPQVTQAAVDRNVAQGGSTAAGLHEKLLRDAQARKGAR
jgi:hypothetical protein